MQTTRGEVGRETDTQGDGRWAELPGEASTSIPGWELARIFASEGAASCRFFKLSSQPLEGPQGIAECFSAIAETGDEGILRLPP